MELKIKLPHKYSPRTYQKEIFEKFNEGLRRFLLVWHRRSGKDKTMLNFMICRMSAFIFTPRGRNHAFFLWEQTQNLKGWFTSIKTVDDTKRDSDGEDGSPVMPEEAINEERRRGAEENIIQQEYYCSFVGYREGSYYGNMLAELFKTDRIREVSWDPKYPVFTGWDLGVADQCAIWFAQRIGREIYLIDYYQNNAQGLVHYISHLKNKPYVYSNHYAPHDIEVREFTSGRSRREIARDLGIYFRVTPKLGLMEGIDYARTILPRCYFDKIKTDQGIRALINYHKDFNQKTLDYKFHPVHDKWSHGADAFRYLCLGVEDEAVDRNIPTEYVKDFDLFPDPRRQNMSQNATVYDNNFDVFNRGN